jgi:hypothetical protein
MRIDGERSGLKAKGNRNGAYDRASMAARKSNFNEISTRFNLSHSAFTFFWQW